MAMRKSPQTQGDVYSDDYGCYDGYERPVSRRARSTARDTPQTQETSENDYDTINFGKKDNLNKIKVSNFSDRCSESFLENYFENKKTFGRDLDVESVQFYQQARYAIVTFKDGRDAARVLEVHKSRPCIEHGCELSIELYIESEDKAGNDTRSIEVRGFSPDTEDDTLCYYFESKRHGGDTTESFKMSPDRSYVIITFEREGVVEEVLKREHEINNHQLMVKKFIVSQCDILFTNISAESTEEAIQYYLEAKIAGVVSLVFSQDRSKVLATFEETINFEFVEKSCRQHSLHGDHMIAHPVAVTDGIIVTNIAEDSTSADTFRYYFENPRRSSGGDVYDVQLHAEDGICLVFFKDPKVVQSVCAQAEHTLGGKLLQVKPYNSCLGLPAGTDTATFSFPDPVIVDSLDPLKQQYLEKSWNQRDELECKLKDKHANISWEKPFPKIECAVTSSVRNYRQMVKSWTKDVQKVISDFDDMVEVQEFHFDPEELGDIKSALKQVDIEDAGNVIVKIDRQRSRIVLIAPKYSLKKVGRKIKEAVNKAKDSYKRKKERKTVKKELKPWSVKYLKCICFGDEMKRSYPEVDIDIREDSCQIIVTGPQKHVTEILLKVYEVIEQDVGHETPKHWSVMKDGQQLRLISLASSDKEYQEVLNDFTVSLGRQPKIQKIERIQNVTLYAQYAAKKKQIESMNPKQKNERKLWHGTAANALDSINYLGFNRSYCGKNATALGAGVYFAVQSNYSDQDTYTPRDSNNNKHMYRARVLTGDYTAGNSNLRVPPSKDAKNPHILFDSVTNNTSSPMMFVIFHDTQAYPEYVITYQ